MKISPDAVSSCKFGVQLNKNRYKALEFQFHKTSLESWCGTGKCYPEKHKSFQVSVKQNLTDQVLMVVQCKSCQRSLATNISVILWLHKCWFFFSIVSIFCSYVPASCQPGFIQICLFILLMLLLTSLVKSCGIEILSALVQLNSRFPEGNRIWIFPFSKFCASKIRM